MYVAVCRSREQWDDERLSRPAEVTDWKRRATRMYGAWRGQIGRRR
jgi:hypothetical protein